MVLFNLEFTGIGLDVLRGFELKPHIPSVETMDFQVNRLVAKLATNELFWKLADADHSILNVDIDNPIFFFLDPAESRDGLIHVLLFLVSFRFLEHFLALDAIILAELVAEGREGIWVLVDILKALEEILLHVLDLTLILFVGVHGCGVIDLVLLLGQYLDK